MTGLYSVTSRVMGAQHLFIGSANDLSLGRVIRHNKDNAVLIVGLLFALIVVCLLVLFLRTKQDLLFVQLAIIWQ